MRKRIYSIVLQKQRVDIGWLARVDSRTEEDARLNASYRLHSDHAQPARGQP